MSIPEAIMAVKKAQQRIPAKKRTGSNATRIPKGSIVFTGRYKGTPAYNMVILYDEKGNVVGGKDKDGDTAADQLILAPDPKDGQLGEVFGGSWI